MAYNETEDYRQMIAEKKLQNERFKPIPRILIGLVLLVFSLAIINTYDKSNSLKNEIKENGVKIDSIELSKNLNIQRIKLNEIRIFQIDSILIKMKIRERSLLDSIKKNENEYKKNRRIYVDSDIDKRIRIFSELAAESD